MSAFDRVFDRLLTDASAFLKWPIKRLGAWVLGGDNGLSDVRILSGPARGARMFLDLRREAGYWVGCYDRPSVRLIQRYTREGMTAYDCGAYVGYYTAVFASIVGPSGRVVAIEPDPLNFLRVKRHVESNRWGHVQLVQMAVGEGHGTVRFVSPVCEDAKATSHIDGCYRGKEVSPVPSKGERALSIPCAGLDELIFEKGYPKPDFLKLDIEGAEAMALQTCDRLAREIRPHILVEVHNPECDEAVSCFMKAYDYGALDVNFGQRVCGTRFVHNYDVKRKQFTLLLTPLGN